MLITKLRVGHWEVKPTMETERTGRDKRTREGIVTEAIEHMCFW